jgi:metal-responsive CopG/Arc/MetJ family transcriptional regulator
MKKKLCVTVEEDLLSKLDGHMSNSIFRNKSHLVEHALQKFLEEEEE